MNFFEKIKSGIFIKLKKSVFLSFLYPLLVYLSFVSASLFVVFALGAEESFRFASIIFTLLWSGLFTSAILVLPKKAGQVTYGILYMLFLAYGIAEHVYHNIFDKMFSFTVMSNIKEGAGYVKDIFSFVGVWQITVFLLFVILGIFIIRLIGKIKPLGTVFRVGAVPLTLLLIIISQFAVPPMLGKLTEKATWNSFEDPRYIYENNTDPHKCLGMTGYYQYLWRDFNNCFIRPYTANTEKQKAEVDAFFLEYGWEHKDNDFTGLLKGKNVIIVMLESIDWQAVEDCTV